MYSLGLTVLVAVGHGGLVLGCVPALEGARIVLRRGSVGLEKLVVNDGLHSRFSVSLHHVWGRNCVHSLSLWVRSVLHKVLLTVETLLLKSASVSHLTVLWESVLLLVHTLLVVALASVPSLVEVVLSGEAVLSVPALVPVSVGEPVGSM